MFDKAANVFCPRKRIKIFKRKIQFAVKRMRQFNVRIPHHPNYMILKCLGIFSGVLNLYHDKYGTFVNVSV